jgi:hypothetical protein
VFVIGLLILVSSVIPTHNPFSINFYKSLPQAISGVFVN